MIINNMYIKYITLIRVREIDGIPQFNTLRLESFPQETWINWWNRHKTGELDEPFKVYKTKEVYNHQALYEFKQSIANIYEQQEYIDARNAELKKLLDDKTDLIEFNN